MIMEAALPESALQSESSRLRRGSRLEEPQPQHEVRVRNDLEVQMAVHQAVRQEGAAALPQLRVESPHDHVREPRDAEDRASVGGAQVDVEGVSLPVGLRGNRMHLRCESGLRPSSDTAIAVSSIIVAVAGLLRDFADLLVP
jgi:hypothetical protein